MQYHTILMVGTVFYLFIEMLLYVDHFPFQTPDDNISNLHATCKCP